MKIYLTSIVLALVASTNVAFAQIRANNAISTNISAQSAFLDASANGFSTSINNGKGIAFPRTDLTIFTFATPSGSNFNFPTAYDGMIVYNSATGSTPAAGSGVGAQPVTPGFYYFSNPTGGATNTYAASTGRWVPLAGNPKFNVTSTETATNTLINGNQVYARKGTFTTSGTSTAPISYGAPGAIIVPVSGTASIYRVTIYKASTGSVYANGVYSYNSTNGNLITGSPSMSVVYPADSYDYIVEYTK